MASDRLSSSHGEILAKSFSAIAKLSEAELVEIMELYMGGATLRAAETFTRGGDVTDLAINYALYGALAEIFARATGFNKGMGGSMHAFFPPFGVMPNNAIVGGSADIATGAALFKRVNRRPGIVIANIGDASIGCGPVWEALIFAAMDQYRTLWDQEVGGNPPILFNFNNNFYGMGGQPKGETMGFGVLARLGLGVNPAGMHAERIDGYNPLAVADAIERERGMLESGQGPVLLDTITYRFSGHSPSDASSYRDKSEVDWAAPVTRCSTRCPSGRRCRPAHCRCACRSALSTGRSTRRIRASGVHPRPEDHVPRDAIRRQRHAQPGAARYRPGRFLREPAALLRAGAAGRGRRADRVLRGRAGRAGGTTDGRRRDDRDRRGDSVHRDRGRDLSTR